MKIKKAIKKTFKRTRNIEISRNIDYETLCKLIKSNKNIIIVDVRSPQEFAETKINSSINLPVYDIAHNAKRVLQNKSAQIVLYCQSGERSKEAYNLLEKLGYSNLYNLERRSRQYIKNREKKIKIIFIVNKKSQNLIICECYIYFLCKKSLSKK